MGCSLALCCPRFHPYLVVFLSLQDRFSDFFARKNWKTLTGDSTIITHHEQYSYNIRGAVHQAKAGTYLVPSPLSFHPREFLISPTKIQVATQLN